MYLATLEEFSFVKKTAEENEVTALDGSSLHCIQQCFPRSLVNAKRTTHTPPSHLMVGAPCTNLDTEQLSIPFHPIVKPFPQLGDQSLVLFQLDVFC